MLIYTTEQGVAIHVERGKKRTSPHDFRVLYMGPLGRFRTPKHIHLIVELYVKEAFNHDLTLQLRDHMLSVFDRIQPIDKYPPTIQIFDPTTTIPFQALNAVGEFSVEFLLVVSELVFIQEKTNYPRGSETQRLYKDFMDKDRYSVIAGATWRGWRG